MDHSQSRQVQRTHLFVMALSRNRKSVRLLTFQCGFPLADRDRVFPAGFENPFQIGGIQVDISGIICPTHSAPT